MGDAAPLAPGATVGILGGGQLGRMLALAAARLGLKCHIFCPDPDSPAFDVAAGRTIAAYDDGPALAAFAAAVDVVTTEFENVPAATLAALSPLIPVRPGARSLEIAQDRLAEKRFLAALGIPVPRFAPVSSEADFAAALGEVGCPAILKTRRLGYDGKGQARIADGSELGRAFAALGGVPAILEEFVRFDREVSVVAARGLDGAIAAFDPVENEHSGGILRRSRAPATFLWNGPRLVQEPTEAILVALGHVGVLAVEFFIVDQTGSAVAIANEFAPRVHNSGHLTEDACATSQFEQHIRAVAGWPLGSTGRNADAEMENLIGEEIESWRELASEPGARLHLYGKREARPGRKMGHVTRLRPLSEDPHAAWLRHGAPRRDPRGPEPEC